MLQLNGIELQIEIGAEIVVDLGALVNERQASKVEMVAEVRVKVQVDMAAAAPANLLEEKPKVVVMVEGD